MDGYYDPNGKARLLSPQLVFNQQQGVSGFNIGNDKFFTMLGRTTFN